MNRTEADITSLLQLNVETYFDLMSKKSTLSEKKLINKVRVLYTDLKLPEQVLSTLQAPMDHIDFKDILNQFIKPTILDIIEQANENGSITQDEQRFLNRITMKTRIS